PALSLNWAAVTSLRGRGHVLVLARIRLGPPELAVRHDQRGHVGLVGQQSATEGPSVGHDLQIGETDQGTVRQRLIRLQETALDLDEEVRPAVRPLANAPGQRLPGVLVGYLAGVERIADSHR